VKRQALARGQRVGEGHLAGIAIDRLRHQQLVGEAHLDPAGQRGDGRVRAIDAPVRADGLDPVEVVGIGDLGRDDVAERRAVARDRAVEMAEALQGELGQRAGADAAATVSPCATRLAVAVSSPERCICQLSVSSTQPEYIAKRGTSGMPVSIDMRRQRPGARAELVGVGRLGAGRDRLPEGRLQPEAETLRVDRHDDIAVGRHRILDRRQRIAAVAQKLASSAAAARRPASRWRRASA
jgi:hypothetical protein